MSGNTVNIYKYVMTNHGLCKTRLQFKNSNPNCSKRLKKVCYFNPLAEKTAHLVFAASV